jgi:hypothetical protein
MTLRLAVQRCARDGDDVIATTLDAASTRGAIGALPSAARCCAVLARAQRASRG